MSPQMYMGVSMKKLILFGLCLVLFSACAPAQPKSEPLPQPENAAQACVYGFLQALKAFDTDQAETYLDLSGQTDLFFLGMDEKTFDLYWLVGDDTTALDILMQQAAGRLEYKATSGQMEADRAVVNCYVKRVDGSRTLIQAYGALKDATVAAALNGKEPPKLFDFIDSHLRTQLHQEPTFTEEIVTFNLKNTPQGWRILPDSALCPLFTAGLFSNPKGLIEAMEAVGIDAD